ncbi:MAG TPA: thiamine phosphate synthase [Holophagaceae bacterium]|nr:thiamine phosphate synthase [Holophagaceae bacterium]
MHLLALTPGTGFDPKAWASVLHSGIDAFMLRERGLEARALLDAARWCRAEAPEVALWVNGRLDVALAAGVGFHGPEHYPEVDPAWVPLSRPLHAEGQWEARRGARQLLVSPIFETPGKGPAWGPDRLKALLEGISPEGPRLLALGGVTPANAGALRHPRLAGIAAIRPFWEGDPAAAVTAFRGAWEDAPR